MNNSRRRFIQTLGAAGAAVAAQGLVAPLSGALAPAGAQAGAPAAPAAPAPSGPFTLPPLPYAHDALEPLLDAATMALHHDKHHAAYVNNLNKAVAGRPDLAATRLEDLVRGWRALPTEVQAAVRNHGGGHFNHSLLWPSLARDGAKAPAGELAGAVDKAFGSFGELQRKLDAAAMSVFGSGWAWLAWSRNGGLEVLTTPNQDCPLTDAKSPLLGIDVWEHAYYLKFQNRRAEYLAAFAQVVDWSVVSDRYRDARKS